MQAALTIKTAIRSRLVTMIKSRRDFLSQAELLLALGIRTQHNTLYLSVCFESIAKEYIKNLCQKLTLEHANSTPATIEIDSDLYCIITCGGMPRSFRSLFNDENITLDDEELLIDRYLDAIEFDVITHDINRQASQLKEKGLGLLARKIVDQINLSNLDGYYSPYRKNGRIICKTWSFNYLHNHSEIEKLLGMQNALNAIAEDAGILFGSAIGEYITAARSLGWPNEKIPSRSIFGKGGHLEIYCYKDKHEYRFSNQAFDAILAFLTINGEADIVERIMDKPDLLEAA